MEFKENMSQQIYPICDELICTVDHTVKDGKYSATLGLFDTKGNFIQ